MKKSFMLYSLVLGAVMLLSFAGGKFAEYKFKAVGIKLVQVQPGVYISTTEVTNGQYMQFLNAVKPKLSEAEYNKLLPDTAGWSKTMTYYSAYADYYLFHPAYASYPVVNITKANAEAYCTWLTEQQKLVKKNAYPKAVFGLPAESEWEYALAPFPDHPLPWYGPYPYNEDGDFICNVRAGDITYASSISDLACVTAPVNSFYPNRFGLYNMIGNVAEITAEGTIKGGSWRTKIEECGAGKTQSYPLPDPRVGFRVVMYNNGILPERLQGSSRN